MKKQSVIFIILSFFLSLFSVVGWANQSATPSPNTPLEYLTAMSKAHRTQNYEQLYLLQSGENVKTLRYRHANWQGKEYAQLLQLDAMREEVILRDGTVSYFGDFQPFSLQSSMVLDNYTSIIYADFNQIEGYNFIDTGRERVADRIAKVIRIVPKDDFRYQYRLWIDEENYLLLKSELLDRDSVVLEEFRAVQSLVDDQLLYIVEPITSLILPTLVQTPEVSEQQHLDWHPDWIPNGFKAISSNKVRLSEMFMNSEQAESQLYSDGLFSFTIYLVENKGFSFEEQFWRNGKMSVYSRTVGDKDLIIVGEIPLVTARHIVQDLERKLSSGENKK
ncbi:negative regulator of sigmaE [Pasteurellaceae bacterium LFhippo2]|nr:negative regulator of sigmaE [Pasteurellaceae bacterium LFhippo2]